LRRLTVLIFLLAVPAPAQAAPLNELPFVALPSAEQATCLRATGTPGALALFRPRGIELRADGTTPAARVRLGRLAACAATATAGDVAVTAAPVLRERDRADLRVAVRAGSAGFGAPAVVGRAAFVSPAVAISPAGEAVVAWVQSRRNRNRVVVARRRPGGAFAAIEPLTPWRRGGDSDGFAGGAGVTAAMSAAGVATVAWALPRPETDDFPPAATVGTAQAPAGGRFTHQALTPAALDVTRVALAVAPDGWSLLAYDDSEGLRVLDRAPAAQRFTEAFRAAPTDEAPGAATPVVAIRDGGGALVAWRTSWFDAAAGVVAATRTTAGAFAAPRIVVPDTSGNFGVGSVYLAVGGPPSDDGNAALRAALAADGRALLAWSSERHAVQRATFAAGTLASGFGEPAALGGPLRDVNGLAPLFLTDGRAAVAWTDNASSFSFPVGQGRLHLAVESAPLPPEPPPPRIAIRTPRRQRLYDSQPVRARVGCDRACDVRVTLSGSEGAGIAEAHSRSRAGAIAVKLLRVDDRPRRFTLDRRRVRVRATAPNGRDVVTATRTVLIRRRPPLPVPRLLDVGAVRRGGTIVVRWRTEFPARRVFFAVIGQRTRRLAPDTLTDRRAFAAKRGRGRTRFRARLRPERPARIRWIGVYASSVDSARDRRRTVVPVR
jgi:hypothetical protein